MSVYWGCAESYRGSGRPSRMWAVETVGADVRPDDEDENGWVAYPFNGMGGSVVSGPHASEAEAVEAVWGMIEADPETGMLHWK